MKRFEVVVTTIPHYSLQLIGVKQSQWLYGRYRWRWLARLNAFVFNTSPVISLLSVSVADVRPILRVVERGA